MDFPQSPLPPNPAMPPPVLPSTRWGMLGGVLVGAVVIGVGAYFLAGKVYDSSYVVPSFTPRSLPTSEVTREGIGGPSGPFTPCPSTATDPTNWQMFNHSELSYTVKYPRDWRVDDQRSYSLGKLINLLPPLPSLPLETKECVAIVQEIRPGFDTISRVRQFYEDVGKSQSTTYTETRMTIGGMQAYQFVSSAASSTARIHVLRGIKTLIITTEVNNPEISQILSTFRFTR